MSGFWRATATGLYGAVFAGVICAILALLVQLSEQHGVQWDLSRSAGASLSAPLQARLQSLESADQVLEITAFSVQARDSLSASRDRQLRDFLRRLEDGSALVRTTFVDFDGDPAKARELGVTRYGTVVLDWGAQRVLLDDRALFRRIVAPGERRVRWLGDEPWVQAMAKLLHPEPTVVYTLRGHGELQAAHRGQGTLFGLSAAMSQLGWTSQQLDLLGVGRPQVPDDAALLLIVGGDHRLSAEEQGAVQLFSDRGGAIAVWIEGLRGTPDWLARLGITVDGGVLVDPASVYPWQDRPLLRVQRHPMTEPLWADNLAVIARDATSIRATPVVGVRASTVLASSHGAWLQRTEGDSSAHVPGAVPVSVALERSLVDGGISKIWVTGDVDLLADDLLENGPGNNAFLSAGLQWLALEQPSVVLNAAPPSVLEMTRSQRQRVQAFSVVIWPLFWLCFGVWRVWLRRR